MNPVTTFKQEAAAFAASKAGATPAVQLRAAKRADPSQKLTYRPHQGMRERMRRQARLAKENENVG